MPNIPVPDFDDPKEVYAFFGLAMFNANLVETSLINLAVVLHLDKVGVITREVFEATFGDMESKTLGQLLKATRTLASVPSELEPALRETLAKRNHLAHNFFRENAEEIIHPSGKREMIEELYSMIELFKRADELVTPVYMSLWEKYGVTESFIQAELAQAYSENESKRGGP
ncbi:MAG: hypothetical protein NTW90_07075 [Nitrosospira sp.]|nr:hypothetical protein [Nitrosospira sp.]